MGSASGIETWPLYVYAHESIVGQWQSYDHIGQRLKAGQAFARLECIWMELTPVQQSKTKATFRPMDAPLSNAPRISVCMAAYNGSLHIEEQIRSILVELGDHDELVVVNDASTDETSKIVSGIADSRVRLIDAAENIGYVRTFERALSEAKGEYIFLSDQDDIWIPGRVELMVGALQHKQMVASNCEHFDGPAGRFHEIRLRSEDSPRKIRNIVGIVVGYRLHWGCAMAFRMDLRDQVLPFPTHMTESHDQWLALVGNMNRTITYMETDTILHRLHGQNLTPSGMRGLKKILSARLAFVKNVAIAWRRARATGKK